MMISKEFIENMKAKLIGMKEEILSSIRNEEKESMMVGEIIGDSVDIATSELERRSISYLKYEDMKILTEIENALLRIENGTYGICQKSGKEIPLDRLEALPYALYTIEVQNKLEGGRRRYR